MLVLVRRIFFVTGLLSWITCAGGSYYEHMKCFATGDCIHTMQYHAGGYVDEFHRWLTECNDGEGMTGVFDAYRDFTGVGQMWCKFMFPLKPPSRGIYPFYPLCNVRNITMNEFYCYDKYWPQDTADTFTVALYSAIFGYPVMPSAMKCCKTPAGYHLDYNRCEWKYTHDKEGEHYDGYWLTKCETGQVMTGLGIATGPQDNLQHVVWIQCCPVVYTGTASSGNLYQTTTPFKSEEWRSSLNAVARSDDTDDILRKEFEAFPDSSARKSDPGHERDDEAVFGKLITAHLRAIPPDYRPALKDMIISLINMYENDLKKPISQEHTDANTEMFCTSSGNLTHCTKNIN